MMPIKLFTPIKLREGSDAYTLDQVVRTRKVTKYRGVIERANRAMKRCRALASRMPLHQAVGLSKTMWKCAAVLSNRYGDRLAADAPASSRPAIKSPGGRKSRRVRE